MDGNKYRELPLPDVIEKLRRAGHIWFRNDDLLMLEELIRRTETLNKIVGGSKHGMDNRS